MISRFALVVLSIGLLAGCGTDRPADAPGPAEPDSALRAEVVSEIEALNAMRSRLAQTIGDESVDQGTFARVCKPVGKQAMSLSQTHGWTVQQIAKKYRNPANQLDSTGAVAYERFANDPALTRLWTRVERDGTPGWRYYRRIIVEPTCLACHGAQQDRPAFIKEKYPNDKAYGFSAGDLRGLYAVFVPDSLTHPPSSTD